MKLVVFCGGKRSGSANIDDNDLIEISEVISKETSLVPVDGMLNLVGGLGLGYDRLSQDIESAISKTEFEQKDPDRHAIAANQVRRIIIKKCLEYFSNKEVAELFAEINIEGWSAREVKIYVSEINHQNARMFGHNNYRLAC